MKEFISMSGIVGKNQVDVIEALKSYFKNKDKELKETSLTMKINKLFILYENKNNSVILYPKSFSEFKEIALYLEKEFKIPIFNFFIYDMDSWMYELYYNGKIVDKFKPLHGNLKDVENEEVKSYKGNPKIVCKYLSNITFKDINKYYRIWDDKLVNSNKKAYPNDEFPYGVNWQLVDFMKKFNLRYPITDEEETIGRAFKLI